MLWSQLRKLVFSVLVFVFVVIDLLLVHQFVLPIVGFLFPSLEILFYDWGVYGGYPVKTYVSFDLSSPLIATPRRDENCNNGLVLLTPTGSSVVHRGPTILDSFGELVWMSDKFKVAMNLKIQRYQDQDFLTFWSGEKAATSGKGVYYMLDSEYRIAHEIRPADQHVWGDLHEFKITKNDTALLTIYNVTTIGRPSRPWITDSVFQEIDIATGELLFEWRASDYFDWNETRYTSPLAGYDSSSPFDFFHINSVDKDSQGNYIISSRHMHSITYISPTEGILWSLGGPRNDFKDLSNGEATNFKWQHDARWLSEKDGILTVFDNGEAGLLHLDAPFSRGLMIQLDFKDRTATLLHSYVSSDRTRTPSQGSLQVLLENNHVFIGWGHSPLYSEFSLNGTLLCESHFGATWLSFFGPVVSYRAQKVQNWVGNPQDQPSVKVDDGRLYVSWNGATEVEAWELQGAENDGNEKFVETDVIKKEGFEESFELPSGQPDSLYRVAAIDRMGQVMRYSMTVRQESASTSYIVVGGSALGLMLALCLCYKRLIHWRGSAPLSWYGKLR